MNFNIVRLLGFLLLFTSCRNNKTDLVELKGFNDKREIIFSTKRVNFHLSYKNVIDEIKKLQKQNSNEDYAFKQTLKLLNISDEARVFIPDTLGSKIILDEDFLSSTNGQLIRVRDSNNQYALVTEEVSTIILNFARKGNLKIVDKKNNKSLKTILVNDVETDLSAFVNLQIPNDSIVLYRLKWIH